MSVFRGIKSAFPYVVSRSSALTVETECGRKFLDLTSGIGVTNLGHSHPVVTEAVKDAVGNLVHAQQNIMKHRPMLDLVKRLSETKLAQSAKLDSWYFWNGGCDAVEGAIKLARHATGKPNVISMNLGYHGRTYLAMALTTSGTYYRAGFGPLPSGVFPAPFPYVAGGPYANEALAARRSRASNSSSIAQMQPWGASSMSVASRDVERCLAQIELMLKTQTSPSETAAILIEPVLGEGGYVPPPPGFMSGLRKICDKNGILLIADEVQTGFGRTGTMFACEWIDGGVSPDIVICAKGLGNGFPISAVGSRKELTDKQTPGSMGGTYGGNAVSCAAALAVFKVFEQDRILENVNAMEIEARARLSLLDDKLPGVIKEVRGKGLMIGIEFESIPSLAAGAFAASVVVECEKRDLLVLSCGPYDTLRLIPPLNITKQQLTQALDVLEEGIRAALASANKQQQQPIAQKRPAASSSHIEIETSAGSVAAKN